MSYPKIEGADWEKVNELALMLVNLTAPGNESEVDEALVRSQLLIHLEGLEDKYGPHPAIYDTIADHLPPGQDPIPWRLKAYEVCAEDDHYEKILISKSICEHYIEDKPNRANAILWHHRLVRHCSDFGEQCETDSALSLKKEIENRFGIEL